jgi:hypothetical protein
MSSICGKLYNHYNGKKIYVDLIQFVTFVRVGAAQDHSFLGFPDDASIKIRSFYK